MVPIARLPVIALVAAASLGGAQRQLPRFQSATHTVMLYATVRSGDGRLAPNLPREAFTVLDNGRPADLTVFSNDPQPITVALLIDMSGSMERHFLRVRAAAREFIKALQPVDRVRIGTFGHEVALSPHLTGDKRLLTRVIDEELWPGGGTPMWKAAHEAMVSLDNETGRRVILIITDGQDSLPHTADEAERRATKSGFMVYGIGIEGTGLDPALKILAGDTGGGHFDLAADDDLAATFARVAEELRHQYVLGFTAAALDGKRHRIDVRLATRGLKAQARRHYDATADAFRK